MVKWIWLAIAVLGCGTNGGVDLFVDLRTDHEPLREFDLVEVETHDPESRSIIAQLEAQYLTPGVRAAVFEGLAPSDARTVEVRLLDRDARIVAQTAVRFQHRQDQSISIALQKSCEEVSCEEGDRCFAETCVENDCISGLEPSCASALQCESDDECLTEHACAKPTCIDGACYLNTALGNCDAGDICTIEAGCQPESTQCVEASDCAAPSSDCAEAACVRGQCVYDALADGAACESRGVCTSGICVTPDASCSDGVRNQNESDVDCGGVCDGCEAERTCQAPSDCESTLCYMGRCQLPGCGNGLKEPGEGCDDGGLLDGDGCNAFCALELGGSCLLDMDCASNICDTTSTPACEAADTCGNSRLESEERCDDGGIEAGDGCSPTCMVELGGACSATADCEAGVCDTLGSMTCELADVCGNGVLELAEHCDDGNLMPGDGCDASCVREDGAACTRSPQCVSGLCSASGICTQPSCSDGLRNQGEAGADCGGPCGASCGAGAATTMCTLPSDCASNLCGGGYCSSSHMQFTSATYLGSSIVSSAWADAECAAEFGSDWVWLDFHSVWVFPGINAGSGSGYGHGAHSWYVSDPAGGDAWIWIVDQSWECYENGVDNLTVSYSSSGARQSTRQPCTLSKPLACRRNI